MNFLCGSPWPFSGVSPTGVNWWLYKMITLWTSECGMNKILNFISGQGNPEIVLQLWNNFCAGWFLLTWYKSDILWKRESQLRNGFYPVVSWAWHKGFSWLLIVGVGPSPLWAVPSLSRWTGFDKKATRSNAVNSTPPTMVSCSSCLQVHVPFPICFRSVVYNSNRKQLRMTLNFWTLFLTPPGSWDYR